MDEILAILIDQIPLGIITYSSNGHVEYVNQNFHKYGIIYQFNSPVQKSNLFEENIFPSLNITTELKEIIKGRAFEKEIRRIDTRSGGFISLIVKGSPIYDGENISGGILLIEDLKVLAEVNEELKLKSKVTDDFIEKGDEFLIVTDKAGDIKYSAGRDNPKLKLSRKEITGKNIGEVFNSSAKQIILDAFSNAINYRKFQSIQFDLKTENTITKVSCRIDPIISENGYVQFLYLIFKEFHEEKKEAETKPVIIAAKSEAIAEPFCKIDNEGNILFANYEFKTKLNFPDIELYSKNLFDLIITGSEINIKEQVLSLTPGEIKSFPVSIKNFSGTEEKINISFKAENFENEKPQTIYCYPGKVFDIEDKSRPSIYSSLFTAAQDGLAVITDEKILFNNDAFACIFGYKMTDNLENKNILELVSKADLQKIKDHFILKNKGLKSHERIEFLAKKKDGSTFFAEFSVAAFKENGSSLFVILAADVTERKRTQKVLRESEQKYRNITENIDDFLYTFERVGKNLRPIFYTSAVQKVTGYSQDEFLSDARLLLKIIHPDDFTEIKVKLGNLLNSPDRVTSELELRIINKDGNVVWVRNKVNLVRDANGKIQRIYGLVSDITLNRRAEEDLKESTENLRKLNEAKDKFLSIISHDLRTPFSSILGFTDLLLDDDSLSETEKKQYILYIQESSKSMLALVNSLLDWTRLQTGRIKFEPERINAKELVDRSISAVSGNALKKGIKIENIVDSSHHLFVDKNLILQVFNNLLSNAIKFTKRGDRVTISAKASPVLRFLQFSVKDTGKGIKPENLSKLFNFDTKFTSEGTAGEKGSGLGLSLVNEIILKHNGTIEAKSEFERGAEFIFNLPVASAKILIVDHNKRDRILYSKILMNIASEYAVSIVSNGKEALERINISPPALIITEHEMPVMNGYTLVKELIKRGFKSSIPVIVLTNKIERSSREFYSELGIEHIFTKPVNLRSFKEAIEKSVRKGIMNHNHST